MNIVKSIDNTSRTVTLDVSTPPTGTSLGLVSIDQSFAGGTAVNTLSITSNVSMTAGGVTGRWVYRLDEDRWPGRGFPISGGRCHGA